MTLAKISSCEGFIISLNHALREVWIALINKTVEHSHHPCSYKMKECKKTLSIKKLLGKC